MSTEADPINAHPGRPARKPAGTPKAAGGSLRRGHRVPIVKELPRRWDPRTEAEVTKRETD